MSTILVVEDTEDSFDLIQCALEEEHDLIHAKTGQEGLAKAKSVRPDLILLDMRLPGMNGWEVARHLKTDRELAVIPLIAVTAHAMAGDRQKCLDVGCDDYIAKPITVQNLVSLVHRHLSAPARSRIQ